MRNLLNLALLALVLYGLACLALYLFQGRMLFIQRSNDLAAHAALNPFHRRVDGPAVLSGWLVPAREPTRAPLVFYFGGNAEDVSLTALEFQERGDANVALFNYRGYGDSGGTPSQDALWSDALRVYDALTGSATYNGRIGAFGRSLGTGVAVYLATERPIDALVLVSPYQSITAVARHHYPWVPVGLLLQDAFDAQALIPGVDAPVLFIVAGRDQVIPTAHSQRLAEAWPDRNPKQWTLIEGASHNNITNHPGYWPTIQVFWRAFLTAGDP